MTFRERLEKQIGILVVQSHELAATIEAQAGQIKDQEAKIALLMVPATQKLLAEEPVAPAPEMDDIAGKGAA